MVKHIKLRTDTITIDARYQRELDEHRATSMAKGIDMARIGVPVIARREDGTMVVLDGQHRVSALNQAGMGTQPILCEVHEGLSLIEEAALFLKLNGGRKAVREYDKWRAELVARVPMALEIDKVISSCGLRITKSPGRNCICAIGSVRSVHMRFHNLAATLSVLKNWSDGDPGVYEGELIKAVGVFLATYPDADPGQLIKKLETYSPERIRARIARTTSKVDKIPASEAAVLVLREVYNFRSRVKLMPLHRLREAA